MPETCLTVMLGGFWKLLTGRRDGTDGNTAAPNIASATPYGYQPAPPPPQFPNHNPQNAYPPVHYQPPQVQYPQHVPPLPHQPYTFPPSKLHFFPTFIIDLRNTVQFLTIQPRICLHMHIHPHTHTHIHHLPSHMDIRHPSLHF